MTDVRENSIAQSRPTTGHEQLLERAVERSLILKRVMRRAVQELRGGLAASEESCPIAPGQHARGGTPGFGEAQFHVLDVLDTAGSLPVGEIADHCHVAVPTISKMLNHLEEHGWIERHVDRANRRVVHVVLTDAGRAAKAQMEWRMKAALARVFSPLTDAQLADVIVAFGHLARLVDDEASTAETRPAGAGRPAPSEKQ